MSTAVQSVHAGRTARRKGVWVAAAFVVGNAIGSVVSVWLERRGSRQALYEDDAFEPLWRDEQAGRPPFPVGLGM